ncbi:MAG: hypothetical protein EXR92_03430 [Gemmatimonadetes bacterium]|nr:hypothetical protein [Gemmatimonadota bacterium]
MTKRWILAIGGLALAILPVRAHAQAAGSVELGLVARQNIYDTEVGIESAAGIGGRLGVFVGPDLEVELEGSYAEPRLSDQPGWEGRRFISHELYQARIAYTHWLAGRVGLLLGGGYAYDHYHRPRNVGVMGGGLGGLIGLRFRFSDAFSGRFEWTGYLVPADKNAFPVPRVQALNLGGQMGVSLVLRRPEERVAADRSSEN